jgi:abhydrolase domain-containing protein 12
VIIIQLKFYPLTHRSSRCKSSIIANIRARSDKRLTSFNQNAGHVAQGQRPATYRSLTSASPKIHVFTIDYRGFGLSTGTPSERGLEIDGVALVNFVLGLGIPPSRIIILGQSLGTAVSSAVALHFADPLASEKLLPHDSSFEGLSTQELASLDNRAETPIDFEAIILVASFSSLPKLLLNYRISGLIPLLSPLRPYPRLQSLLVSQLRDTWNTSARISALTAAVSKSENRSLRLHIIHAMNDWDIPWRSGEENFDKAEEALTPTITASGEVERMEGKGVTLSGNGIEDQRKEVWLGERGRVRLIWEILRYGGES